LNGWGISPGPIGTGLVTPSLSRQGILVVLQKDRPKPYTRVTKSKGARTISLTTQARAYYSSQDWLRGYLRSQILTDEDVLNRSNPFKGRAYLFGLAIDVPLTKSGCIPKNVGDYDNYLKAWLDAITPKKKGSGLTRLGIIEDDNLAWYRGPCHMRDIPVMASDDSMWRFHWRIKAL